MKQQLFPRCLRTFQGDILIIICLSNSCSFGITVPQTEQDNQREIPQRIFFDICLAKKIVFFFKSFVVKSDRFVLIVPALCTIEVLLPGDRQVPATNQGDKVLV